MWLNHLEHSSIYSVILLLPCLANKSAYRFTFLKLCSILIASKLLLTLWFYLSKSVPWPYNLCFAPLIDMSTPLKGSAMWLILLPMCLLNPPFHLSWCLPIIPHILLHSLSAQPRMYFGKSNRHRIARVCVLFVLNCL